MRNSARTESVSIFNNPELFIGFILTAGIVALSALYETYDEVGSLDLYTLYGIGILIVFVYVLWVLRDISIVATHWTVYAFYCAFIFLLIVSPLPFYGIGEFFLFAVPPLLYIVVPSILRNDSDRIVAVRILLVIGAYVALVNVIGYFQYTPHSSYLASNWGYKNTFAAFLSLMSFIGIGEALHQKKWYLTIIPAFFNYTIFMTVSRGGELVYIAGVIILLIVVHNKKKAFLYLLYSWLFTFVLIAFFAPRQIIGANIGKQLVLAKFASGESYNFSLWTRIHLALLAFKAFLTRPLIGYGLGTFRFIFALFENTSQPFRVDPHSLFFRILSETGILGTVFYFSFVGTVFYRTYKFIKEKENFIFYGVFAGVSSMFLHMLIDADIYIVLPIFLFVMLGMLAPYKTISIKKNIKRSISTAVVVFIVFLMPYTLSVSLLSSATRYLHDNFDYSFATYDVLPSHVDLSETAYRVYKCPATALFYASNILNSNGNIDKALSILNTASVKYDYRIPLERGLIYLYKGKVKDANKEFITAERLYPSSARVNAYLSISYFLIGNNNKGKAYLKRAEYFDNREARWINGFAVQLAEDVANAYLYGYYYNIPHTFCCHLFEYKLAEVLQLKYNAPLVHLK